MKKRGVTAGIKSVRSAISTSTPLTNNYAPNSENVNPSTEKSSEPRRSLASDYSDFMGEMSDAEAALFDNFTEEDYAEMMKDLAEIDKQMELAAHNNKALNKTKQEIRDNYVMKLYDNGVLNSLVTKMVAKHPQMAAYFKDSKMNEKYNPIFKNGKSNYIVMFHGSENNFNAFDTSKVGKHGTVKGSGFYFISSPEYAKSYTGADSGRVFATLLNIEKPLSTQKHEMTKAELRRFIREVVDADGTTGYLSNYDDVKRIGYNKLIDKAVDNLFEYNSNDADVIEEIFVGSRMDYDTYFNGLKRVLGYDGVIMWNRAEGTTAIAFSPNQIKDIFNYKPTANPDIRRSIAGQSSRTANLALRDKAVDMMIDGKSAQEIWEETGFFMGKDGNMRYEIDDSKSKISDKTIDFTEKSVEKLFEGKEMNEHATLDKLLVHKGLYDAS